MNVSEQSLIDDAQGAIGDGERVLAAGVFQPRKASGALTAGTLAGVALSAIPGVGGFAQQAVEAATDTGGYMARHVMADEQGIPVYMLIAVTDQHLFAFKAKHDDILGFKVGQPFATWDRDHIAITVHGRAGVRTFQVDDLKTGEKFELETPRFSPMHGTVVIKLLQQD